MYIALVHLRRVACLTHMFLNLHSCIASLHPWTFLCYSFSSPSSSSCMRLFTSTDPGQRRRGCYGDTLNAFFRVFFISFFSHRLSETCSVVVVCQLTAGPDLNLVGGRPDRWQCGGPSLPWSCNTADSALAKILYVVMCQRKWGVSS